MVKQMKSVNGSGASVPVDSFVRYALQSVGSESCTSAHPKHKLITWMGQTLNGLLGEGILMKLMLKTNKGTKETGEKNRSRLQNEP